MRSGSTYLFTICKYGYPPSLEGDLAASGRSAIIRLASYAPPVNDVGSRPYALDIDIEM